MSPQESFENVSGIAVSALEVLFRFILAMKQLEMSSQIYRSVEPFVTLCASELANVEVNILHMVLNPPMRLQHRRAQVAMPPFLFCAIAAVEVMSHHVSLVSAGFAEFQ